MYGPRGQLEVPVLLPKHLLVGLAEPTRLVEEAQNLTWGRVVYAIYCVVELARYFSSRGVCLFLKRCPGRTLYALGLSWKNVISRSSTPSMRLRLPSSPAGAPPPKYSSGLGVRPCRRRCRRLAGLRLALAAMSCCRFICCLLRDEGW